MLLSIVKMGHIDLKYYLEDINRLKHLSVKESKKKKKKKRKIRSL